jgi:putative membrane protein
MGPACRAAGDGSARLGDDPATRETRDCTGALRRPHVVRGGGTLGVHVLAVAADTSFSLAPGPILIVLVLIGVYARRWRQVRASGNPRGAEWHKLAAWLGGVLCIAIALISPVDTLADQVFFMHMVQHVLLLDFAPILLIWGLSKVLLRPVARQVLDLERALGPIAHPVFAIFLYVGFMWVWHIPFLYDAALSHSGIHVLEHTCFLSAGLLYWWHLLSPVRGRHLTGLAPVGYMAATKVFVGMLGIFLTFAPTSIYDFYNNRPEVWGIHASDDQALAGAIMAIEQSIVMGIALAYLFVRALNESERKQEREDRYLDEAEERRTAETPAVPAPPRAT